MVCLLAFGVAPSSAQWYQLAVSPSGRSFYSGGIFFSPGGLWLAPVFTYPTCYSSLDTGKTWTTHTFPRVGLGAIRSIRFFDKFNGVIEFTANSTAEITSDGGQTWIETYGESLDGAFLGSANRILEAWGSVVVVSQPPFSSGSVIFLAGGGGSFSFIITPKGTAFAGHDPIQMSTDFGATWQPRLGRYDLDSYSMDVGKYCDDSTIYIANEWDRDKGEIYVSTDAGNSFVTKLPHSLYGYITGSMVTSNHAAFCATSTDGVLRSTDKGQAWKSIGGPGSGIDVRSIAVINDSTLFVLDTLGILWETTNSGGYPFKAPLPPKPQIVSTPANVSSCDSTNTTVSIMHTYCDPLTITEATFNVQKQEHNKSF